MRVPNYASFSSTALGGSPAQVPVRDNPDFQGAVCDVEITSRFFEHPHGGQDMYGNNFGQIMRSYKDEYGKFTGEFEEGIYGTFAGKLNPPINKQEKEKAYSNPPPPFADSQG